MRHARNTRILRLGPVLAFALAVPASFFGVNTALQHLGSAAQNESATAGCASTPCDGVTAAPTPAASRHVAKPAVSKTRGPRKPSAKARAHPKATRSTQKKPGGQAASAQPQPTVTATPTGQSAPPPANSPISVSYQELQSWPGGFYGQFVVVNHSQQPIGDWQITATLPGDEVTDVFDANWTQNGDALTMGPQPGEVLDPGVEQMISVFADGGTGAPTACTVNGEAC